MTYRSHVKNGVAALDEPAGLPEGVEAEVGLAKPAEPPLTLGAKLMKHVGKAQRLPPDMSVNFDHYLRGTPKR
ncbi:hypothetical protein HYR69_00845 [Candidatus Sumerlaeota bacterium]|nr:hypothetical protein [Candidatus Sumerlaeota bacterium]MBI3737396.1 hypothetical protein [Candidatus Sumerlaeota bacterium]